MVMPGTQLWRYVHQRICVLLSSGASTKETMQELAKEGIKPSRQMVWRLSVHQRKHGFVRALPWSGRPTKLTDEVLETIENAMQNDDEHTVREHATLIQLTHGISLSFRTILRGRRLHRWPVQLGKVNEHYKSCSK